MCYSIYGVICGTCCTTGYGVITVGCVLFYVSYFIYGGWIFKFLLLIYDTYYVTPYTYTYYIPSNYNMISPSLYNNIIYNIKKIIINFYIQTILINIVLC